MGRNIAHTPGGTIDGAKGKNAKMERGTSVSDNPIWRPGGGQSPTERFESPKYANQTGDNGQTSVRSTPFNQHGITGKVEPAKPQPKLGGHDAG
jgi:hypothetical protein